MRADELATLPANYMFWDKDLCKYATIKDVEHFVSISDNTYGTDYEMRLQCFGRFRRLAYTGLNDKNKRPIYEGHIVKASYKIMSQKIVIIGAIGFENGSFVIVDKKRNVAILSAFDSEELKIIGNIFENPELLDVEYGRAN